MVYEYGPYAVCGQEKTRFMLHSGVFFFFFFSTKKYKYFSYFSMKTYVVGTHQYLHVFVDK